MKKLIALLIALLMLPALVFAAEGYTPAEPKTDASAEDYNGEWICRYAGSGSNISEVESRLESFGMHSVLTMEFRDGTASFVGISEMENGPVPFTLSDGAMVFEPEEGVRVFTLKMLQDGVIVLTFDMVDVAVPLYLFRVEAEAPAA